MRIRSCANQKYAHPGRYSYPIVRTNWMWPTKDSRIVRTIRNPLSAVLVTDAKPPAGGVAGDVVEGAADGAGPALDAVAEADQVLLLLLVPLVDPGGAEVVAVLPRALGQADVLVDHLDMRLPGVLVVLDGEELVGQLLHQPAPKRSQIRHIRRTVLM